MRAAPEHRFNAMFPITELGISLPFTREFTWIKGAFRLEFMAFIMCRSRDEHKKRDMKHYYWRV